MRSFIKKIIRSITEFELTKVSLFKILLVYLLFLLIFSNRGLIKLYLTNNQLNNIYKQIEHLNIQKTELEELAKYNQDQEKILYYSREKLGLVKKNEKVIFINELNNK